MTYRMLALEVPMRDVPRLSLPVKLLTIGVITVYFAVEPILDAPNALSSGSAFGPSCSEGQSPIVDRLLPEGAGGTVFYDDLDGNAGVAFQASGVVGLALNASSPRGVAATEFHERAHLLEFARPDVVARLMRGQPAPASGQYAATSPVEHFAEMAGEAWHVTELLLPGDFCAIDSPANLLRQAEADVPGTAGFVAWYLRDPEIAAADGAAALRTEAERLILVADRRADWDALYAALGERQWPDGGFRAWPDYSVREYLERRRAHARLAGGFSNRVDAVQISASLGMLALLGR